MYIATELYKKLFVLMMYVMQPSFKLDYLQVVTFYLLSTKIMIISIP